LFENIFGLFLARISKNSKKNSLLKYWENNQESIEEFGLIRRGKV